MMCYCVRVCVCVCVLSSYLLRLWFKIYDDTFTINYFFAKKNNQNQFTHTRKKVNEKKPLAHLYPNDIDNI